MFPALLKYKTPAWEKYSAFTLMALHCWFNVFFLMLPRASRLRLLLPLAKAQGTGQLVRQVTSMLVNSTGTEQQYSAARLKGLNDGRDQ